MPGYTVSSPICLKAQMSKNRFMLNFEFFNFKFELYFQGESMSNIRFYSVSRIMHL